MMTPLRSKNIQSRLMAYSGKDRVVIRQDRVTSLNRATTRFRIGLRLGRTVGDSPDRQRIAQTGDESTDRQRSRLDVRQIGQISAHNGPDRCRVGRRRDELACREPKVRGVRNRGPRVGSEGAPDRARTLGCYRSSLHQSCSTLL
ncbi:hypothetical protein HPP92_001709 [Vanilla planifolia]|uniref:Uncharacterized protein n=1 Tax=Vanilla planifolia TaxID=51239 RepID=A0A835VJX4_VANPL|nr:hypothetical protein HPP92_001709 [Vanilla planifolia]